MDEARDVLAKRCEEYSEEPYNLADRLIMDLFNNGYDIVPTVAPQPKRSIHEMFEGLPSHESLLAARQEAQSGSTGGS